MIEFARNEWKKAERSLTAAEKLINIDPDSSVSRAYYSVFHAVTSLFAFEGKEFTRHSAIRAAVHRDLVKPGKWPITLGADYDFLLEIREMGDYGGMQNISKNDAEKAVACAQRVIEAVAWLKTELLGKNG